MTRDPSRTIVQHTADALALVRPTAPADTPLEDAVGAVLAADVVSALDAPAFDASAMDGYAVRAQDVAGRRRRRPWCCASWATSRPGTRARPGSTAVWGRARRSGS